MKKIDVQMKKVRNVKENEFIYSFTPYHPKYVEFARHSGANWVGISKYWVFALKYEKALLSLCEEIWGTSGLIDEKVSEKSRVSVELESIRNLYRQKEKLMQEVAKIERDIELHMKKIS